jgi:hypothetical protein
VAAPEEREHGERVVGVVRVPGPVLALLGGQVFEPPVDGRVDAGVGLRFGRGGGFGLGLAEGDYGDDEERGEE